VQGVAVAPHVFGTNEELARITFPLAAAILMPVVTESGVTGSATPPVPALPSEQDNTGLDST